MAAVTEDSNVVLKAPVAPSASFDAIKQKGVFGWDESYQTLTVCPVDGGDYKRLGLHPDSAPLAASLNSTDTILVSVGGVLKRTTVQAIGGGGTWQPLDSDLTAIAALTTAAFGRSVLTQVDAAAVRTLIGAPSAADLAGYQPLDSDLTAIAALTTTAFGRSVLTQADAAAVRTLIGAGTSSFNGAYTSLTSIPAAIDALDNLTPAADRLPYFTNGTTAALATFSAFARTLVDDADAATARATLGAGTVSSVSLSLPAIFTVSGSPVTGSGTLSVTLASQTADKVFASPSGASGVPAFISLASSHIPNLPWNKITTGLPTTLVGYGIMDGQPLDTDLTAIAALSGTGFLQRTGSNTWTLVAAPAPAAHAPSHEYNGADPITGQNISGLRTSDSVEFNRVYAGSDVRFKRAGVFEWGMQAGTSGFELASRNADWSAVDWPITIGHAAGGVIRLGGTTSRPVNLTYTLQMGGVETISSTREGTLTRLSVKKSLGATIDGASRVDLLNDVSSWGQSSWIDSGGDLRFSFLQGDATWTDRYTFGRNGNLNLSSGSLQVGAVNTITSTREGRFTGLRLSNHSAGQFPYASDANGQIVPSALSQAATEILSSRKFRTTGDLAFAGELYQGSTARIDADGVAYLDGLLISTIAANTVLKTNADQSVVGSGMTDDGTFLGISRTIRAWNSMTRSGNTWTALQWTHGSTVRTTMLSSDGSGASACHALTMVPAATETANEDLGFLMFGQRLSGKSGTNPGLKIAASGRAVGSGGSTGGFGGQLRFEYRPDNGANLVDALRIGAFGGITPDAVETAILLRALAGVSASTVSVGSLGTGMVKSMSGALVQAAANTDYLPPASPVMTGIGTYQRLKTGITTVSTSASTPISTQTNQFINITYTGMATLRLYTPGTDIAGIVYKVHCKGCTSLKFTMDTAGSMLYLNNAGGASNYWYTEAGSEHTFTTNSSENVTCDVWTDGDKWYVRW